MIKKEYIEFYEKVKKILLVNNCIQINDNNFILNNSKIGEVNFKIMDFDKDYQLFSLFIYFENRQAYNNLYNVNNTSNKHNLHYIDKDDILELLKNFIDKIKTN